MLNKRSGVRVSVSYAICCVFFLVPFGVLPEKRHEMGDMKGHDLIKYEISGVDSFSIFSK